METIAQMLESRGMERGLQQGRQEGQRELMLRQLARRFGDLPATVRQRVAMAGGPELERWADRLLFAGSLDEVFAAP